MASAQPAFPWALLLSCTLTPQIMPVAASDILAWRQSTLHAMRVLQQLSSTAEGGHAGGCIKLASSSSGVPELPFAWHYHGHDDDRELQEAFASLLACNYAYSSPHLLATAAPLVAGVGRPAFALPERVEQLHQWKQRQAAWQRLRWTLHPQQQGPQSASA
jgi:hypothetical protein